ncbi:type II secretion system secretin GspD [Ectothiorhodospiraceae bacterium WFHF3C12]|nr:type II secretion system secretin GspD [Ectothiorhodospiraceae bacterium WFHF3C12]
MAGALLALATVWPLPSAVAQEEGKTAVLNLKDTDITALIETVSDVTGRNFIVDPRVKAKVTVISNKPMRPGELYEVFLSILQVHGFSAVPSGEVTKIVPDINAKQLGQADGQPPEQEVGDEIVTRVIRVQNVPVAQLVPILRPLVPQQGHFAAYPPTNVLIISDRAANIDRLTAIINRIDRAGDEEVEVIRLKHASASEVVRVLNSMQQGQGGQQPPGEGIQLAADERTNSILMSGDKSRRLRLRGIIAHLDTPLERGGDTQVIYLKYAKAKSLVEVLTGVSENLKKQQQGGQDGGGGGGAAAQAGEVNIQADEDTNALVITAPPKIQQELEAVIRQLDVRRAQVLIEAAIAEVSLELAANLGLQWAVDGTRNQEGGVGGTNFSNASTPLANLIGAIEQETVPQLGAGLNLAVGRLDTGTRFGVLLQALRSNSDTNVLSTPSLLTLDNEEAEIRVAQNVPFVTGSYTQSGTSAQNPFQTVERKDVGLIMKVTPQINEGNAIMLDIEQEVSNVVSAATASADNLITNKRSIKTSVLVDDGDLVILGGLIDEDVRQQEQKVPLLGDIPFLGELFRYRSSSSSKNNLMVFMRPRIIRDQETMNRYAANKYNYMRAEQLAQRQEGVALLPDETSPVLPPLDEVELPDPFPQAR